MKTRSIPKPKGAPAKMGEIQWTLGLEVQANLRTEKRKNDQVLDLIDRRKGGSVETHQKRPMGSIGAPSMAKGSRASVHEQGKRESALSTVEENDVRGRREQTWRSSTGWRTRDGSHVDFVVKRSEARSWVDRHTRRRSASMNRKAERRVEIPFHSPRIIPPPKPRKARPPTPEDQPLPCWKTMGKAVKKRYRVPL